ncbi:pupal cuticle protein Edg-78E-like [Drosophila innubila]|uniref:pupal cuticle protein Edg-78E-like n=1 Tax=Drosophila innubila TaxID=198719 RepID=UPI00148C2D47|nr:pupal cuticle protein Edg-78E-like [Drosophila innubila]
MYKHVLLLTLLIAVSFAHDDDAHAHAEESKKEDGHGNFNYMYEITNGIGAKEAGDEHRVTGGFHFVTPDGKPVGITYTADEHGYQPHGDALPTPPPTPEAILKALAYIEAHPHKEEPQHPVSHEHGHGHAKH